MFDCLLGLLKRVPREHHPRHVAKPEMLVREVVSRHHTANRQAYRVLVVINTQPESTDFAVRG